jgi:hypothetical protein
LVIVFGVNRQRINGCIISQADNVSVGAYIARDQMPQKSRITFKRRECRDEEDRW